MKIILFSDLHYFAGDIDKAIFNTSEKLVKYALPILDKLIEKANEEAGADIVINLGDTIQDTTEHDKDIEALKFVFERLKKFSCPCYSILGNHDLKMMDSVSEVEAIMGYESTYSLDLANYHLVFLTTEVRSELGTERGGCYKAQYLSEKSIKWLEEDLKQNMLPALIFTHYALAEDDSRNDECMFMKNRAEVKKILREDENVKAVFSGHQHIQKILYEDGLTYYVVGSPIADKTRTDNPSGIYIEIDLGKDSFTVTEKKITKAELSC